MVFSSLVFILLYLPIVLAVYYLIFYFYKYTHNKFFLVTSNFFILLSSIFFYFWGEQWLIFLMLGVAMWDYACAQVMSYVRNNPRFSESKAALISKISLIVSITTNLAMLGVFKYFNFAMDSVNAMLLSLGATGSAIQYVHIALPLGISFYTFQSMSYTIDVYNRQVESTKNLINYNCFVTIFPHLVAGPIVRYRDIGEQMKERNLSFEDISEGVKRFIIGLAKKVIIANGVALTADKVFALPQNELTFRLAWIGIIAYTLQIYFDFSGYSDMAIGLARMMGFKIPENFNYPYISSSIQDFWRRWHISLSNWFRDYLFLPLSWNKTSKWRLQFNLLLTFVLCGLWHGASFSFIVWGFYYGVFLVIERFGFMKKILSFSKPLSHLYAILVVMIGWVLFRSDTLTYAINFLGVMFGLVNNSVGHEALGTYLSKTTYFAFYMGPILSTPIILWGTKKIQTFINRKNSASLALAFESMSFVVLALLFMVCIASLSMKTHNPFIYFRF